MIWGNCCKNLRDKLQRLQNRAARVLTNSNYDADASILLNDLGGKTLKLSGKFRRLLWCVNYFVPDYMSSKFILRSDLFNSYNLEDSENKLAVSLPRTN